MREGLGVSGREDEKRMCHDVSFSDAHCSVFEHHERPFVAWQNEEGVMRERGGKKEGVVAERGELVVRG